MGSNSETIKELKAAQANTLTQEEVYKMILEQIPIELDKRKISSVAEKQK